MTVTVGTKTLNVIGMSEAFSPKLSKIDSWENGGYKRKFSSVGGYRTWQLDCYEKNVAWADSAAKYLQEQAALGSKLDFSVDLGDHYGISGCKVYVLGCHLDLPAGDVNYRTFSVELMEASAFSPVLDESCVLYLPMDEGAGGTVYDKSEHGNNGTIYGATWADGKFGKALSFDGVDDYVEVPDSPSISPTSQVTVACWVKYNAFENVGLVWKSSYNYVLCGPEGGLIKFVAFDTAGASSVASFSQYLITLSSWHFIVGTLGSDGKARIYLDGSLVGTADSSISNIRDQPGNLFIGKRGDNWGDTYLDGYIDDVRIYNRALSADEIRNLFYAGLARIQAKTLRLETLTQDFELAKGEWDGWENEAYVRKLKVLGQKRNWSLSCLESGVPWTYSAYKYLQYKAYHGKLVAFQLRGGDRYNTEELECYVTGLSLQLEQIGTQNIRSFTVNLEEA